MTHSGIQPGSHRAGIALGDVVLFVSGIAVLLALAYPRLQGMRMNRDIEAAVATVDTVVSAARRHNSELGAWPPNSSRGTVPPDLAPYLPRAYSFAREDLVLTWERWERVETTGTAPAPDLGGAELPVDSVEVPVTVITEFPGLTVWTPEEALLAALLDHYGPARSFVRDSTWTLILPPHG